MEQLSADKIIAIVRESTAELKDHILRLENKFDTLEAGRVSRLEKDVVTFIAQMEPIKKIVYGLVGTILLSVLGSVLALIIIKN